MIKDYLNQKKFAVIGSFRNEEKFAYKIFNKLRKNGYTVVPVNPAKKEVDGVKCYPKITDIDDNVDVAVFVTPPKQTEKILCDCLDKNIKKVWFQPGAESKDAIEFCKKNNLNVVYGMCLLITSGN